MRVGRANLIGSGMCARPTDPTSTLVARRYFLESRIIGINFLAQPGPGELNLLKTEMRRSFGKKTFT